MKVWVTRDKDDSGCICFWDTDKFLSLDINRMWDAEMEGYAKTIINEFTDMGPEDFKRRFGFTPRKGSCKQYELSLTEIEQ